MTEKKFYAYIIPDKKLSGVTESWKECEKFVKGIAGARFRGFKTRAEAEAWLATGAVYEKREKRVVEHGVYFDAGTGRGDGVEVNVTDQNGKSLLAMVVVKKLLSRHKTQGLYGATNNYGELLACKYALQIAMQTGVKKVFGDSKLVIDFWSQGIAKKKELPEETYKLVIDVSALRRVFEAERGVVERISGDDNPADLGFHR